MDTFSPKINANDWEVNKKFPEILCAYGSNSKKGAMNRFGMIGRSSQNLMKYSLRMPDCNPSSRSISSFSIFKR